MFSATFAKSRRVSRESHTRDRDSLKYGTTGYGQWAQENPKLLDSCVSPEAEGEYMDSTS